MPTHGKILVGWAVIAFFVLQIGIDLAHSVTLFPFVHYGMYSQSFPPQDSLEVFEVRADGRLLSPSSFRIYRWDMIQTPLIAFDKWKNTADFAFDRMKLQEYMERTGTVSLYRSFEPRLPNAPDLLTRFPAWYKRHLAGLLGHPITTLSVDKSWYRYTNGQIQLLRKENFFIQ
jgi:hypothetical protein